MTHRKLAASTVAAIGIGLMLVPVEASARPGGLGVARPMAFHGGFRAGPVRPALVRPGFVRPALTKPFLPRPAMVKPFGPRPAVAAFGGAKVHLHGGHRLAHRKMFGGYGLGPGLGGPYVYGTFYSADDVAPIDYIVPQIRDVAPYGPPPLAYPMTVAVPAPAPEPERVKVIVYRPAGCDVQTVVVPSEAGGMRQINIVRC